MRIELKHIDANGILRAFTMPECPTGGVPQSFKYEEDETFCTFNKLIDYNLILDGEGYDFIDEIKHLPPDSNCLPVDVCIYHECDGEEKEFFNGEFTIGDIDDNCYACKAIAEIYERGIHRCIKENWERKIEFFRVPKKTILNIFGDENQSAAFFNGSLPAGTPNNTVAAGQVPSIIGTPNLPAIDVQGNPIDFPLDWWVLETQFQIEGPAGDDPIDTTITTIWVREEFTTGSINTLPPIGTNWIPIGDTVPQLWVRCPSFKEPINDARSLNEIIDLVFKRTAVHCYEDENSDDDADGRDVCMASHFYNYNTNTLTDTPPANTYYATAAPLQELYITQKSDAKYPNASNPAKNFKHRLCLKELLDCLVGDLKFWIEETPTKTTLRIEHISWEFDVDCIDIQDYKSDFTANAVVSNRGKERAGNENYSWAEEGSEAFQNRTIIYKGSCLNKAKTDSIKINCFCPDVFYIQCNPLETNDEGFVIQSVENYNGVCYVRDGNEDLTWDKLLEFYKYEGKQICATLNGNTFDFENADKTDEQKPFIIQQLGCFCFDPITQIQSKIGKGKIKQMVMRADCSAEIELVY